MKKPFWCCHEFSFEETVVSPDHDHKTFLLFKLPTQAAAAWCWPRLKIQLEVEHWSWLYRTLCAVVQDPINSIRSNCINRKSSLAVQGHKMKQNFLAEPLRLHSWTVCCQGLDTFLGNWSCFWISNVVQYILLYLAMDTRRFLFLQLSLVIKKWSLNNGIS